MGPWLILVIGVISGFLIILIGIYIYRVPMSKESKSHLQEEARSIARITLSKGGKPYRLEIKMPTIPKRLADFVPSARFGLYAIAAFLAGAILFSTFFGIIGIFGFMVRLPYLLIAYFLLCLAYRLDSRVSIGIALFLLALCPILLIMGDDYRANSAANVAYAFLAMGVFFQLIELFRERRVSVEGEESGTPVPEPGIAPKVGEISQRLSSRATVGRRRARRRFLIGLVALITVVSLVGGIYLAGRWFFVSEKAQEVAPEVTTKAEPAPPTKVEKAPEAKPSPPPKVERAPEAKPSLEIDKSKIKIQVLNGNGVAGEAARIADVLKGSGFDIQAIADADYDAYPHTFIRHKPGQGDIANAVAKEIEEFYPALLYSNLSADADIDIVLILGRDKKGGLVSEPVVDKSKARIDVLNGNGIAGSAREIADLLKRNGFNISYIGDADRYDYAQTVIRYRSGNKDVAQLVADEIKPKYSAILEEEPLLDVDIVVVLGNR